MDYCYFVSFYCPSKWGSQSRPIQVSDMETIHEFKVKVLTKMNLINEESCYVIGILYEPFPRGCRYCQKPTIIPNGSQLLIDTILLEESNWYSKVKLVLLDYRLRKNWNSMFDFSDKDRDSRDIRDVTSTNVNKGQLLSFDTQKVNTNSNKDFILNTSLFFNDVDRVKHNNDDLLFPNAMQQSLSNICLKQGSLKKKVVENYSGKEIWKDVTVYLCEHRMWFYSALKANAEVGEVSYIDLLTNTTAFVRSDIESTAFMILNYDNGNNSTFFRAKSVIDAVEWVRCIVDRNIVHSDNDAFLTAEGFISSNEEVNALKDMENLLSSVGFESMICNNYMRSKFRSFLSLVSGEESLQFWERSEDFFRGHPDSPQKYLDTSLLFKESDIRTIATDVYDSFCLNGTSIANLALPNLPSDILKVKERIESKDDKNTIPATIFKDTQATILKYLKSQYREFLSNKSYRQVIQSAVYATSRNGDPIMATCYKPPAEKNARFNMIRRISTPSTPLPNESVQKKSEVFADMSSSGWRSTSGLENKPWLPDSWWRLVEWDHQLLTDTTKPVWLFDSRDVALDTLHLQLTPYYVKKEREHGISSEEKMNFMPFSLEARNSPHLKRRLSLGTVSSTIQKYVQPSTTSYDLFSKGFVIFFGIMHCRYYDRNHSSLSEVSESDSSRLTDTSQSWKSSYAILIEHQGQGNLMLFEYPAFFYQRFIRLKNIIEISPSTLAYQGIDLKDSLGLQWRMIPVGTDGYDSSASLQRWLSYLRLYCSPQSKHVDIVKTGWLSKRGKINTNYRRRCFVMTSNHFFRYFKDSSIGTVCKGSIDFRSVKSIDHGETGGIGWISPKKIIEKEIILKTSTRVWTLKADSVEEANEWFELFNAIKEKCKDYGNPSVISNSPNQSRIIDDDDDSD